MTFIQLMTKTTRIGLSTALIFALAAGCASQGSSPAPEATTAMNVGADDTATETATLEEEKTTKLICRKIKPTGSRFGERICMRPEQWEKYAGHGKKELERIQSQGLTANPPGG
jgi:hypothetical protein